MNSPPLERTAELETELYQGGLEERLRALRQLCAQLGPRPHRGTNCHIHTSESFSVFRSPTEAVWQAAREGLAVLGINDHYTIAGHEEFRRACELAGIAAAFSLEAVAMDRDAEADGLLLNDPDNPGRVYLCGKGVTRNPPDSSVEMRNLARMRAAIERRNREMTEKVDALFKDRLHANGPTWESVRGLTPRGNATERHVAWATLKRLREWAAVRGVSLSEALANCCGAAPQAGADDAALQIFLRAKLLKAGAPCFVRESEEAFVSVEELRRIFLAFGSIPTYPVHSYPIHPLRASIRHFQPVEPDINVPRAVCLTQLADRFCSRWHHDLSFAFEVVLDHCDNRFFHPRTDRRFEPRHVTFDAIPGVGGLSGEFGILVTALGPAVCGVVGAALGAYLKGRQERKAKLRVGLDGVIEAEAQTPEEVEKLVTKAEEIWRRNQPKVIHKR